MVLEGGGVGRLGKALGGSVDEETLATALKDMWSQIGVEVTITPVEVSVREEDYDAHNFQALKQYWTNDIVDPDELVAYAVLPESSEAFQTGWNNAEAQDLAREGASELDAAKRKEIYFRIQDLFNQDSPSLPLYYTPYVNVTTAGVHNFNHPPTGEYDWKLTWIEQ